MIKMDQRGKTALAGTILITALFTLASIFILPQQVQIVIGEETPAIYYVPSVYALSDCLLLASASFLLGASLSYLLIVWRPFSGEKTLGSVVHEEENEDVRITAPDVPEPAETMVSIPTDVSSDFEATSPVQLHVTERTDPVLVDYQQVMLRMLKGNERKIIETLIDHGEMNQTELSDRTEIPKSTLSRTLQDLEARSLVHRYENGMSKMVKLETLKSEIGSCHHTTTSRDF
ncbi:winged helix-turn-helix transcriptional regulator [Methanofollis formosanus]|uniref:Winged helix-turn-helix transcriptional regulator n=1 Tax=Methanofollis formosanus TaxID=299308 RepID=A0A8G1EE58_9EURY|nr:helix-turn-helix domain-containing protein [Methanofollis formosanus]QYZ77953.1 winged helix-turn-helix transcriptional regulator [Methanofollis formosanus]